MSAPGFVPSGACTHLRPQPQTVSSSTCSQFSGRSLTSSTAPCTSHRPLRAPLHMKKGRFHQPLQPRKQDQTALPEDGTPVFAVFVRTNRAKLWYPLGAVQGDDRSRSLVNALKGGFARGMYANALDKGIAQTVYGKDGGRFVQNALRMYPQLKKYSKELEFGYRVSAVGLDEQPTKPVSKEMALSFTSWAKKQMNNVFKGGK